MKHQLFMYYCMSIPHSKKSHLSMISSFLQSKLLFKSSDLFEYSSQYEHFKNFISYKVDVPLSAFHNKSFAFSDRFNVARCGFIKGYFKWAMLYCSENRGFLKMLLRLFWLASFCNIEGYAVEQTSFIFISTI